MRKLDEWVDLSLKAQDNDFDIVWAIVGRERLGKSFTGLTIFKNYYTKKGINPLDKMSNYTADLEQFSRAINKAERGDMIVLDEAADVMTTANYYDQMVKRVREAYTIIGALNLFTIIILPDFFLLDTYFRKFRVKAVIYVYQRGRVAMYCGDDIYRLENYAKETKNLLVVRPTCYDSVPLFDDKEMLTIYRKIKDKKVKATQKQLVDDWSFGETVSLRKACAMMRVSYKFGLRLVLDNKLESVKTPSGQYKIAVENIEKLKYAYEKGTVTTKDTDTTPSA
jgi:hypothetical protein